MDCKKKLYQYNVDILYKINVYFEVLHKGYYQKINK